MADTVTATPNDNGGYPVEPKVKIATYATYFGGLLGMALLNGFSDANLLGALPDAWAVILTPILPALITGVAAYNAKHQIRRPKTSVAPIPETGSHGL